VDLTDNFQDQADKSAYVTARRERHFDDLQDAMANRDTGRQRKHIHGKDIDPLTGKRKSVADQVRETLEWLLLTNQAYAQAHQAAMTSLRSAETTVTNALDRLLANLEKEQAILDDMLSRAPTLPDGRKVFRDKQGNVKTLDGEIIDDELAASIQWHGDEPSLEETDQQNQRVSGLKDAANELRGIETELGGIRGELTNNEKPPTQKRVGELKERIEGLTSRTQKLASDYDAGKSYQKTPEVARDADTKIIIPSVKIGQ